jgi:ankyrin repeat protein
MTEVAALGSSNDASAATTPMVSANDPSSTLPMTNVKTEETTDSPRDVPAAVTAQDAKPKDADDADNDSEAETLIQSPEKRRGAAGNTADQPSTVTAAVRGSGDEVDSLEESGKRSRKRKRDHNDGVSPSRASSSSPLSSPNLPAHSRESDSDVSDTPRSTRSQKSRRNGGRTGPESAGIPPVKLRKRRPSDILPPGIKHRSKGSTATADGVLERRETRSATYPRQSSEERSVSPRPNSSREHRRGVSTQLTAAELEGKKRGRPPKINTRHNRSEDRDREREDSPSSDVDASPAPRSRPSLDKYDSRDHLSPAKPSGPRKYRDKNGRTFLSRACNNDDLSKARVCLRERPEDLNLPDNAGNTPLQIASLEGFVDIVRFLLQSGAEVDTRNIEKDTPLIDAVENGHLEVVKLLLEFGANPRLNNSKGDEPYELVPQDDENYKTIRKLIADAKEQDFTKRRKSSDNNDLQRDGESSRAPSAASQRDSPPAMGPRSPPAHMSRRRTGRSESTRNDLLWQANTQENLQKLAAKGNVQGVATILNVLQKAEPASVIAAAKAGHEEVLQYLLAMGEADPDPEPLSELKPGYNTPMLAAIGRGNWDVVKLLAEQTGFNPSKKWKGRTYYEIAMERKGEGWRKEYEVLKDAYEKHMSGRQKTRSPKKVREAERPREKRVRRSESPPSSNLRTSASPTLTHKSLPDKSPRLVRKDAKKDSSPAERDRRRGELVKDDNNVAVTSDQEQSVNQKRGHKQRRSQSDLPLPANLEAEVTQRRRRLVTGKEHRRSQSGAGGAQSDASTSDVEVKHDRQTPGLKRTRSTGSPDVRDNETSRTVAKKRRTVLESSPEESRPAPSHLAPQSGAEGSMESKVEKVSSTDSSTATDAFSGEVSSSTLPDAPVPADNTVEPDTSSQDAPGEPDIGEVDAEVVAAEQEALAKAERLKEEAEAEERQKEEERKLAEEEQAAAERAAADAKAAAEKIEAERLATEKAAAERAAAERAEAERKAAEEAEIKRKAEEAEAKRKAEEEAAAMRRREEEEHKERVRRELEERKRQQEEQIRQQHEAIERRRREALPAALSSAAYLLDAGDPRAKSYEWLSHFLPLFTVDTAQLEPGTTAPSANEVWIPNFQAAVLLATKDLNLRNYTALERRPVTPEERERLWKVARNILSYDYESNSYNTTIKKACLVEEEQRPKFYSMNELFWVKVCLKLSECWKSTNICSSPISKIKSFDKNILPGSI